MSRYEGLREPMAARKQKLSDSLRLQQLFRDVEDEETWIREKEPIAASTNRGETLMGFICNALHIEFKSPSAPSSEHGAI